MAELIGITGGNASRSRLIDSIVEFLRDPTNGSKRSSLEPHATTRNSLNLRHSMSGRNSSPTTRHSTNNSKPSAREASVKKPPQPTKKTTQDEEIHSLASSNEALEKPKKRPQRGGKKTGQKSREVDSDSGSDFVTESTSSEEESSRTSATNDVNTKMKDQILELAYKHGFTREQLRLVLIDVFKEFRF